MSDDLVKILDGNTFVVSDARGDIEASPTDPTGLFSFDTRFLSTWVLTVDGERLNPLSVDDLQYFETRFFLVPGTGTVYVDAKLSVIRQRAVGDGFHEELTILNHDDEAGRPQVRIEAAQRLRRPVRGQGRAREEGELLHAGRERHASCSATQRETFDARDRDLRDRTRPSSTREGLTFAVQIEPQGQWTTDLDVVTARRRRRRRTSRPKYERGRAAGPAEHGAEPGTVARRRAAARVRLGPAQDDLPAQPRRPGRAAVLPAGRRRRRACPPPGCRGS